MSCLLGGNVLLSGLLGTPVKVQIQHIELLDVSTSFSTSSMQHPDGLDVPWTVDSISSMYLQHAPSTLHSITNGLRTTALKNMIGMPKLRTVRTIDLWLSSSMPLTAACQKAATSMHLDPTRFFSPLFLFFPLSPFLCSCLFSFLKLSLSIHSH